MSGILQVLKHFEDERFGDALYDFNYRRNVKDRKTEYLPNDDDVRKNLLRNVRKLWILLAFLIMIIL